MVAETLRRLSPEKRRESIARLTAEQRHVLEKHLMATPQRDAKVHKEFQKRLDRGHQSLQRAERNGRTRGEKCSLKVIKSKLKAVERPRPREPKHRGLYPKGLSQKSIRGLSYYYASVGCESTIFHCKPVRSRAVALGHLATLQRLKSLCVSGSGSFEQRLVAAVETLRKDSPFSIEQIKVFVRSATQHWLGRDLHTPSWQLNQLDEVLHARRLLQVARGHVIVGGCGLLYQCSIAEAAELWVRIREAYLEVCASVPGCDVQKRARTLDRAEAAFAQHRNRMQTMVERRQRRHAEKEERKVQATQRHLQREMIRGQKAANQVERRDHRALRSLEKLLQRW